MNVDSQFPQPLTPVQPYRPPAKPAEQATERPVDTPKSAEATADKPRQDTVQARTEEQEPRGREGAREARSESELSEEDNARLQELRNRDREVRAHEAAHKAVAGSYARGSAQFTFENGPDGRRYAVGGEVSIDTSKVSGDPQATIQKAQTIRRAANAPAQPSGQDRSVAASATQMEAEARQELAESQNSSSARAAGGSASPAAERIQNASAEPAPVGELLDVIV